MCVDGGVYNMRPTGVKFVGTAEAGTPPFPAESDYLGVDIGHLCLLQALLVTEDPSSMIETQSFEMRILQPGLPCPLSSPL